MRPRRLAALAAALLAWAPAAGAALRAEALTPANVSDLQIGGPDAIGGIGDWYLANDVVEFVIDDPSRRHAKQNHGGTLVDAGLVGVEDEDQFARLFIVLNNSQRVGPAYDSVRAEVDPEGRFARITVWGSRGVASLPRGDGLSRRLDVLVPEPDDVSGVVAETEYEVRPGEPFVRITTRLRNEGEAGAPISSWGDLWMRGGRGIRAFVGNTLDPTLSRGFHHRSFDPEHILEAGDAMAAWTFVAGAGVPGFPSIAYGLFSPERAERGLAQFGVTGSHVTMGTAFVTDPPWEALTPWRLMRSLLFELEAERTWTYERRLIVTRGPDVASVTDRVFPLLGHADGRSGIRGRTEPAAERVAVHVSAAGSGAPITQCLSVDGRYAAVLPPGDYVLTLRAPHRPPREVPVTVAEGAFVEVPVQRLDPVGRLLFEPAFADGGAGRVVVRGVDGTPDPVFEPELLDFRLDGRRVDSATETDELQFVGDASDPRRVPVAPGRYRLLAVRGFEHDLAVETVEVGAGEEVRVGPFAPARAVELRGIVSADLHVHGEASDDSGAANGSLLRRMVAAGVEVMVSTDHDHVSRFAPALEATGLGDRIAVVTGVEVTSSSPSAAAPWSVGHHNAWPIAHVASAHRQGAPPSQDLTLADLYSLLRRDYGASILQLNHPLGDGHEVEPGEFLSHLGNSGERFDPTRPLEAEPNRALLETGADGRTRALDFDAMEVMNGPSFGRFLAAREAWYALLRQGVLRTATGNSDTHGPDEVAGIPRNFVYLDGFDVASFDRPAFDRALRNARSFLTSGPMIAAFVANGGRMGDVVTAEGGAVDLTLAIAAAPWVPVEEVRLLVDGEVARVFTDLAAADEILRLTRTLGLGLDRDAFLTLEAGTPLDVDPALWIEHRAGDYAHVAPAFVPQVVSNPIFVDVDGNGRFDAPGLGRPRDPEPTGVDAVVIGVAIAVMAIVWLRLRRRAGLTGLTG